MFCEENHAVPMGPPFYSLRSSTLMFDYPTVPDLVDYIYEQAGPRKKSVMEAMEPWMIHSSMEDIDGVWMVSLWVVFKSELFYIWDNLLFTCHILLFLFVDELLLPPNVGDFYSRQMFDVEIARFEKKIQHQV